MCLSPAGGARGKVDHSLGVLGQPVAAGNSGRLLIRLAPQSSARPGRSCLPPTWAGACPKLRNTKEQAARREGAGSRRPRTPPPPRGRSSWSTLATYPPPGRVTTGAFRPQRDGDLKLCSPPRHSDPLQEKLTPSPNSSGKSSEALDCPSSPLLSCWRLLAQCAWRNPALHPGQGVYLRAEEAGILPVRGACSLPPPRGISLRAPSPRSCSASCTARCA